MIVLALVKPGNNYGGNAPEGTIVKVEESEIERVPWCLAPYAGPEQDAPPADGALVMLMDGDAAQGKDDPPSADEAPTPKKKRK